MWVSSSFSIFIPPPKNTSHRLEFYPGCIPLLHLVLLYPKNVSLDCYDTTAVRSQKSKNEHVSCSLGGLNILHLSIKGTLANHKQVSWIILHRATSLASRPSVGVNVNIFIRSFSFRRRRFLQPRLLYRWQRIPPLLTGSADAPKATVRDNPSSGSSACPRVSIQFLIQL